MVVRLNTRKSIRNALSYNEKKVAANEAQILLASGFSCDISELGFSEKLNRFQRNNELRPKVETNTLHIVLSFAPEDKLSDETMQRITKEYMEKIGFEEQPYIAYKHKDTAQQHIHIVTTSITDNGEAIYLHKLVDRLGEPARQQIEKDYELIVAQGRNKTASLKSITAIPEYAIYGEEQTKKKIEEIVSYVYNYCKFTSIEEYNAILATKGILADQGKDGSFLQRHKALQYSIIDADGQKKGIAIKASDLHNKPTLARLKKKFARNKLFKDQVAIKALPYLHKNLTYAKGKEDFINRLRKAGYEVYADVNLQSGIVNKIQFINEKTRLVFTNEDLQLTPSAILTKLANPASKLKASDTEANPVSIHDYPTFKDLLYSTISLRLYHHQDNSVSPEFFKKKKKKNTI